MSHDVSKFSPLVEKKSSAHKVLEIPNCQFKLEIDYNNPKFPIENIEEIKKIVEANLLVVYDFIEQLFQEEQVFTRSWVVNFSKDGGLKAQGKVMVIPITEAKKALENRAPKDRQIFLSQVAHEVVHNITDNESLPMLIELIFLIESEAKERIRDIYDLFLEKKLPNQYIAGLNNICGWLGLDIHVFFKKVLANEIDVNNLKELLKKQVKIEITQ